ncbi:DUF3088 family protein [uncultured Algimonas sp.]|uniref:DUF3088 family protein n=1 Tax=uncultured Algimonas sp. TaxID=1547920 RepID=UPI002618597E|nr:DUF3088 family protein [uncultured Algimonas sp.]
MTRDALHLLPPGFQAGTERQYCPECAEIWGLLGYYPALRETLRIVHEGLSHPRSGLVAALGVGTWNCPTLVLHGESPDGPGVSLASGTRYVGNARDIAQYWSAVHGTALPR